MPSFDFEVYCDCGTGLCNSTTVENRGGRLILKIEPCSDCLDAKYGEGLEDGRKEAEEQFERDKEAY